MTKTLTQRIESKILEYATLAKLSLSLSGLNPENGERKRKYLKDWIDNEIKSYESNSRISKDQLSAAKSMYGEIKGANWTTRENIEKLQAEYD